MPDTQILHGGAPTPDVFMSTTDQRTILGNGTTHDPLRVAPGVTAAGLSVVLRPGGQTVDNVVTTFEAAIALLGQIQGDRVLQLDDSLQSPIVIPPAPGVPGTPWQMLGVELAAYPGRSVQVRIPEGTSFSGLRKLSGPLNVTFTGTTPAITDLGAPGAPTNPLFLDEGAAITVSGAGPLIRVTHAAGLRLGNSAGVLTGPTAVIDVVVSSLTVFGEGPFATLRDNTVSGDEDSFLLLRVTGSAIGDNNGALSTTQVAFTGSGGTVQASNFTAARSYPTSVIVGAPPSASINLDGASVTVPFNPTAGPVLIFLPPARFCEGQDVTAKNVTSSVANDGIIVAGAGDTVEGGPNVHVTGALAGLTVRSDGVHTWYVVSRT